MKKKKPVVDGEEDEEEGKGDKFLGYKMDENEEDKEEED